VCPLISLVGVRWSCLRMDKQGSPPRQARRRLPSVRGRPGKARDRPAADRVTEGLQGLQHGARRRGPALQTHQGVRATSPPPTHSLTPPLFPLHALSLSLFSLFFLSICLSLYVTLNFSSALNFSGLRDVTPRFGLTKLGSLGCFPRQICTAHQACRCKNSPQVYLVCSI